MHLFLNLNVSVVPFFVLSQLARESLLFARPIARIICCRLSCIHIPLNYRLRIVLYIGQITTNYGIRRHF